jgi:hypothetical protein
MLSAVFHQGRRDHASQAVLVVERGWLWLWQGATAGQPLKGHLISKNLWHR